jgi:hypothetical protein
MTEEKKIITTSGVKGWRPADQAAGRRPFTGEGMIAIGGPSKIRVTGVGARQKKSEPEAEEKPKGKKK